MYKITEQGQPGGRELSVQSRLVINARVDQMEVAKRRTAVPTDLLYSQANHDAPELYTAFHGQLVLTKKDSPCPDDGLPLVITCLNGEAKNGMNRTQILDSYDVLGTACMPGSRHGNNGHPLGSTSMAVAVRTLQVLTNRSGSAWVPGHLFWDIPTPHEASLQLQSGGQVVPVLRSYSQFSHGMSAHALRAEIARPRAAALADTDRPIANAALRFQRAMGAMSVACLAMWLRAGVVRFDSSLVQTGAGASAARDDAASRWMSQSAEQREMILARLSRAVGIRGLSESTSDDGILVPDLGITVANALRCMLVATPEMQLIAPAPGTDSPPGDERGPLMAAYNAMLADIVGAAEESLESIRSRICGKALTAAQPGERAPVLISTV